MTVCAESFREHMVDAFLRSNWGIEYRNIRFFERFVAPDDKTTRG